MNKTSQNVIAILWLVFGLTMLVVAPFTSIWSINTIFGTRIAYTFGTWFAVLWLSAVTIAPKFK